MSGTIPPIPPPPDTTGGSHVTNVPEFDKEDFTSWKFRFLVFLDGLEPYHLKTLEGGPFVPMTSLSTSKNSLPKRQNQWSNAESRLANQDKRLKSIIISCLPNDVMKSGNNEKGKNEKEKSEKGLTAESFNWDEEFVSLEDERTTKIRAFMAIAMDEPSVGKADARSGQWVYITMKKDEISDLKRFIDKWTCSKVTLDQLLSEQIPSNIVKALRGIDSLISLYDLTLNMADLTLDMSVPKKTKPTSVKVSLGYVIKKKTENKSLVVSESCTDKKADSSTEQFLFTLMEEIKEHAAVKKTLIKLNVESPLNPTPKKATMILKPFKDCKYCGFNDHHFENSEYYPGCEVCGSVAHEPADCPKKHPNSRIPRIANKQSTEPTEKYSKESGPKVVFGDDSSGDIKGYGLVNYKGITFTRVAYMNGLKHNLINISQLCNANFKVLFTKTQGTIFNKNDEVVLIALRRRDVYVIDMLSFNKDSNECFFAKASPSVNWLWHKRLSHLNFKNINNLAKHNLVSRIPSLTFSKDKNCSACEKRKHQRASFKTKRSFSINKSLHHLHMDLFRPVKPQTISHNKYTLVVVDEYSRYTWVFFLKKKSDAADCIMSFIRKIENLNEVRVKKLRSDNETEFRNHKLEEFYDEKGISQNFSSCTPEQNGVAERRNKTLIKATSYDVFRGRSPNISYLHVFRCLVHIHNHRDHLGNFDEMVDDGFFLGYSLVAKSFRVFNIRRQEMEETLHVTFSEDDEVNSQSNIEGDAINFNEKNPFLMMNSLNQGVKLPNPSEFTEADDHPALNKLDQPESADYLKSAKTQDNVIIDPIRDTQPSPTTIPPSANLIEALEEEGWIIVMQEELNPFERNKVWTLGYNQHEWIDYEETFAPVARLEAIRIFLAYAAYMGFMVYQIDVKSAFLNGKLSKELYVQQPHGFESNEFPNHVCKLDKALYGLQQAPKAWYQANPKESHLVTIKRIFRKSTSGDCQILDGKLVCWSAKKKSSVAMLSVEAEYVAAAGCCAQVSLSHDRFNNNVSFEEELVYQRLRKTLTHVLELSSCIYLDDRAR
nr:hypothetical protein [Tanacetum cinerariifolium]